jgi:hypothetical protein
MIRASLIPRNTYGIIMSAVHRAALCELVDSENEAGDRFF